MRMVSYSSQAKHWIGTKIRPTQSAPLASQDQYLDIFRSGQTNINHDVEQLESRLGYRVDNEWLDKLALRTQVVKKKSPPNWNHGKLLYSLLRHYLDQNGHQFVYCFETGTARGFSALVQSRALADANRQGIVFTVDILTHHETRYWNCIADHEGPMSRQDLLAPWKEDLERVVFVSQDSERVLTQVFLPRVNFAFLDGSHSVRTLEHEFNYVAERQLTGDVIVFDDCTELQFPEICRFVGDLSVNGLYSVEFLQSNPKRGYAVCYRK